MSLFKQMLLPVHEELIVDLFAGGGGASSGIEQALGRQVDIAINHDRKAVSLHMANHPQTRHYVSDVFEVDPRKATDRQPIGLLWASPDCTYHSKARGAKPIRSKNRKRRALAWVVTRWAGQVRPRTIMLENVEEFLDWGPLVGPPDKLRPCKKRRGKTFKAFVRSLKQFDYRVEWRELRACDYGAPTIRKRLFLIARCDGLPIEWPEPTHGPGRPLPYRVTAECIDWSIPMLTIFATKEEAKAWGKALGQPSPIRPLADNTYGRIARGVKRFVLDNPKPFLVSLTHAGGDRVRSVEDPLATTTCAHRGEQALVSPTLVNVANGQTTGRGPNAWDIQEPLRTITSTNGFGIAAPYLIPRYGEREGQEPRCRSVEDPGPVVTPNANGATLAAAFLATNNNSRDPLYSPDEPANTIVSDGARHTVVAAVFVDQANNGFENRVGRPVDEPLSTLTARCTNQQLVACNMVQSNFGDSPVTGVDEPLRTIVAGGTHHAVCATHIQRDFGQSTGSATDEPIGTITGGGMGKAAVVASFLSKYYGSAIGQYLSDPLHTISTMDRFAIVCVTLARVRYFIYDIAMRMLTPRELYLCQGFRPGYIIDMGADGVKLTKTEQVRMCGNSVCPPVAEALVRANLPEMIVRTLPTRAKRRQAVAA